MQHELKGLLIFLATWYSEFFLLILFVHVCIWYFTKQGDKLIKEVLTSDVVAVEGSCGGAALLEPSADLLSLTFAPLVAPPPDVEVRL